MEHMHELAIILKYIFLGLFQGLTEPIPISSSGHLILLRNFFQIDMKGLSFEIFVHFGSLIAIIIMYRKDIFRLCQSGLAYLIKKDKQAQDDFHFIVLLVVATIPTAVIGLLFGEHIGRLLSSILTVGITLLITGSALWLIRNLRGQKSDRDLSIKDALFIGFAQTIALVPGISRSGATIVVAMLLGTKQETALRFSFLLYIPVSFGAMVLSVHDFITDPQINTLIIPYILACIAAINATFFALKWFINIMAKGNLKYFSFYCFIVGLFVIFFW